MSFAIFVTSLLSFSVEASTNKSCRELVNRILSTTTGHTHTQTDRLIGYLGELVETHAIGDAELYKILEGLDRKLLVNPISETDAEIDIKRQIHRGGIEKIIRGGNFNYERLKTWLQQYIAKRADNKDKRESVHEQTQIIHQRIEFVPIKPGQFQMGGKKRKVGVILTHPFEVMSTLVTQKQWVDLMGENPSKFVVGEHSMTMIANGRPIRLQPDNPVEQVTWWSVVAYANKLSEKNGLRPAYDLSGLKFESGTRAENGTLKVEKGELKISAPSGNIYEAEGYRLPTEAEQEFLMRSGGIEDGMFHFGNDIAELKNYAWYDGNSKRTTHPVAELKPVVIGDKIIFDLHGNVWEWSNDWVGNLEKNSTNPIGAAAGNTKVLRGGSFHNSPPTLSSGLRSNQYPNSDSWDTGFRLVRTL